MTKAIIVNELRTIRSNHPKKILVPSAVVEAARDEASPLHSKFEWDDSTAAQQYRLHQARQLIAEVEVFFDEKSERKTPAFISLLSDRKNAGGGYRAIEDVLSNKQLRNQMIQTALVELNAMRSRFDRLSELSHVWKAAEDVERRLKNSLDGRVVTA